MIAPDARSGTTVGKYRLHEIVGRGGMGVVYRAEHVYIGREVAVKILHEGYGAREDSIKRFLREARAASLINHPNIVEVTDFGKSTDGTVFFVMELLVGQPLDSILARETRLDLLRSITICNQLAAALAAAHGKGIIHRDLKPENVMLIPREGRRELVRRVNDPSGPHETSERETLFDFVKILDFGVAKVREPEAQKGRVTQAGVVFGTPEYMAPETARVGYSDARSDVYALGVMFYEMLTGVVPFTGDAPVDVMMKQVNERVPRMHDVAPQAEITDETERMILKALAKDPDQRQQSMEEFHRDLQKCYGQVRFRRTLKTPTSTVPSVGAIPLTKKKAPSPGAIPTGLRSGQSASIEIETQVIAPPPADSTPILLTKKKAPRPASAEGTTTPMPDAKTPVPGDRKRNTLPLGTESIANVPGRIPPPQPERRSSPELVKPTSVKTGENAVLGGPAHPPARPKAPTPERRSAASPPADDLMVAVARALGPRPATAAERETPRVLVRSATLGADPEKTPNWNDEPTAPGVSGGQR
ncbi:MAG TPA: protein kinase [Polyangia bacterium]|nr:protein kinase [Polyangia bacterium]